MPGKRQTVSQLQNTSTLVLFLFVAFLLVAGIYHIGRFNFSIMERTAAIGVIGVALLMSLIALIFILTRQQKLKLLQLNRDNELLLDDLIHHQPSGIYRIALNTDQIKEPLEVKDIQSMDSLPVRYIFVSKQHETITGISAEALYKNSQAIFDAIYPDDRASFYASNLKSIREVKRFKWEGRMVAHGQIKWVSFDSLPRLNPPGQIIWTGVAIDITTQKEMELEMESREAFERLITRLSSSFVNVNIENADSIIQSALSAVGNFCGTDRAYIFSFHEDGVHASNTYEWCAGGINPQIGELQGLDMTSMPQWVRMLNEFKCIDVFDVNDLPESWSIEKQILEPQGIKSLIVVPIYSAKKLFGFVGFDSVKQNRKWKEYEVQLLKVFADLLHTAFERQSSEASINEYQQMLRTVLETIKVRVFWKDKDLIFKGCNEAFAIDAGFSDPEDIIGKDDFQTAWNEQAEKFRADDVLVMNTGKPMLNIEEQQTQADGKTKWMNVTKVPLRNHAGEIVGILGTYQDITSQKLYKDALEASERKYRILTEKAFDGIYLLRKTTFEYVNQRFCDLTGYSYDELTHPEFDNLSLFTPESKQMAVDRQKARAGGYELPSTYEMEIITRSGQLRLVEISTNQLNDAGEENLILGIMRDITERKKI